jgi:hypothetical protein
MSPATMLNSGVCFGSSGTFIVSVFVIGLYLSSPVYVIVTSCSPGFNPSRIIVASPFSNALVSVVFPTFTVKLPFAFSGNFIV